MNKVYVVTRGEYSDYRIECVFSNREAAEKYCAVHWDNGYGDTPMIEEYDVEDGSNIECGRIYYAINFQYVDKYENGSIGQGIKPSYSIQPGITPFKTDICRDRKEHGWTITGISGHIPINDKDFDEDTILKIVYDHISKFKAEEEDI